MFAPICMLRKIDFCCMIMFLVTTRHLFANFWQRKESQWSTTYHTPPILPLQTFSYFYSWKCPYDSVLTIQRTVMRKLKGFLKSSFWALWKIWSSAKSVALTVEACISNHNNKRKFFHLFLKKKNLLLFGQTVYVHFCSLVSHKGLNSPIKIFLTTNKYYLLTWVLCWILWGRENIENLSWCYLCLILRGSGNIENFSWWYLSSAIEKMPEFLNAVSKQTLNEELVTFPHTVATFTTFSINHLILFLLQFLEFVDRNSAHYYQNYSNTSPLQTSFTVPYTVPFSPPFVPFPQPVPLLYHTNAHVQ